MTLEMVDILYLMVQMIMQLLTLEAILLLAQVISPLKFGQVLLVKVISIL